MKGKRRAEVKVGAGREREVGAGTAKRAGAGKRVVKERRAGAGRGNAVGAGRGNAVVPGAGSEGGALEQLCMYTFFELVRMFVLCVCIVKCTVI